MVSLWGGGFGLPETVALAAVALIGYVFGMRGRSPVGESSEIPEDLFRATEIARRLEEVASTLRRDLSLHRSEVERFRREIQLTGERDSDEAWRSLRGEAERVLAPTLRLVGQVATAYDQIRQQSQALSNFSGGRTDPLTGLNNSRALAELLEMELAGHAASRGEFSVAVFSVDAAVDLPADTHSDQQERMLRAAEFIRPQLRDRDLVARYGLNELVVVMPHTRLFGASVFGRRVRRSLSEHAGIVASCGLAQSSEGDTAKSLLARADSALYSAKAAGDGLQYLHTGQTIRPDQPTEVADGDPTSETAGKSEASVLKLADSVAE